MLQASCYASVPATEIGYFGCPSRLVASGPMTPQIAELSQARWSANRSGCEPRANKCRSITTS